MSSTATQTEKKYEYECNRFKHKRRIKNEIKRKILYSLLSFATLFALFLTLILTTFDYYSSSYTYPYSSSRNLLQSQLDSSESYPIGYPPNAFSEKAIKNGLWILYFMGMSYSFIGIAIVCDEYFVPAIEVIVEKCKMSPDAAGATWMAAGGSAPELFTSFIGVFVSRSNVGFGTIVGSAVFNVLFVIGCCAIFTPGHIPLTIWPFARDCSFYIISLIVLAIFYGITSPDVIQWYEALILLSMYVVYVIIIFNDAKIKSCLGHGTHNEKSALLEQQDTTTTDIELSHSDYSLVQKELNIQQGSALPAVNEVEEDKNGCFQRIMSVITAPIMYTLYITLPDVQKREKQNLWPLTFVGSLLWLAVYSFFMVWMATVIGDSWDVPDEVMGLTFLAAATSVPDLCSSVIVAKRGEGDMAVSSSIGSNIFDMLVGLALPWLLYSVSIGNGQIKVESESLLLSVVILIVMLIFVLIAIRWNQWRLTHKLGWTMFILWILFVAQDLTNHFCTKCNLNFKFHF